MISFPNCKINLGLHILRKRSDGFHDVETGLMPVGLHDMLEIIPATDNKTAFTTTGLNISGDRKSNLVMQAYILLKEKYDLPPVHIHLHKKIPMGAGLGGGSADASYALQMLNTIFKLNLGIGQLEDMARQLGSDCAFFIQNKPVIATGKGDQLNAVPLNLSGYHLILVKPDIHISTPEAYSWIKPNDDRPGLREILMRPLKTWKNTLINDFELAVFNHHPSIGGIKNQLYDLGADYAALTGSGAAVFGLFKEEINLPVKFPECFVWKGKL